MIHLHYDLYNIGTHQDYWKQICLAVELHGISCVQLILFHKHNVFFNMLHALEKRALELMFLLGRKLKKNAKRTDFSIETLKLGNADCSRKLVNSV